MRLPSFIPVAVLFVDALGHGGIYNYSIGGVSYAGSYPWLLEDQQPKGIQRRWWPDPIQSVNHPYLACNRGNPLAKSHPTQHAPIQAGTNITAYYIPPVCPAGFYQPTENLYPDEFQDPERPMRCMGPEYSWVHATGPMLVYMANCNGPCDQFEPEGKKVWFKIYESGLKNGGEYDQWGDRIDVGDSTGWDQIRVANKGWNITIPKNLRPGNYLIRHEIIMIELMPPQFYPECAQLTVTGDGDMVAGEEYLVSFPGAYSMDEPGLAISGDLYSARGHSTYNYTIPGPPLWTGGN
ncbi:lytic polysaccharide monooxygenase [Parathielavia appendiculata]|uniref:lytic cellulose monooxygenase (C4-dehydrogenating) n=1 Tax=Parathielavia appendiculata TaxID=2587402 RepID=A0AAN6U515_9PEZI|nr:lytic polysaccharide monooxygenase [Parathielavia appendiculata]